MPSGRDLAFRRLRTSLPHPHIGDLHHPETPVTQLQPARGTHDLIGDDQRRHQHVVDTARRIAAGYGFDEWTTPIFEDTRVFSRTLGETSDVVMKEMYSFEDRGGDPITLRPEATAGICRALVTNGLTQSLPQKVFCAGPMFRYERPQKGRYRQFHQIDIEAIGSDEPLADAEVIACGWDILQALGVAERHRAGDQHPRRPGKPAGLSRRAGGVFHQRTTRSCRPTARRGWSAIRCASSIPRTSATAASSPMHRPSPAS